MIFVGKGAGAGEGLGRGVQIGSGKERQEGDRAGSIGVYEVDCEVLKEDSGAD